MSAHGRAGGLMKALMDGEGPLPGAAPLRMVSRADKFTSKTVSNGQTTDVTMALKEGSVKELVAMPMSSPGRVPVNEANRHGIVDPLTAMLFSSAATGALSQEACRRTLPIFDGHQRYDLKLAFKRMDKVTPTKDMRVPPWFAPYATNPSWVMSRQTPLSNIFPRVAKWRSCWHRSPVRAC